MKVITAPEEYIKQKDDIIVFLAGGISSCPNWQQEVINHLQLMEDSDEINLYNLVICNPRRENFPIHDPDASEKQVTWEFKWLEECDIFSMYFCNSESVQPICMYELGRNIAKIQEKHPITFDNRIIVSIEQNYKRSIDVILQTKLATNNKINPLYGINPEKHALLIAANYILVKGMR